VNLMSPPSHGSPRAGHSCQNASIGWSTATAAPTTIKPAFTSSARPPSGKRRAQRSGRIDRRGLKATRHEEVNRRLDPDSARMGVVMSEIYVVCQCGPAGTWKLLAAFSDRDVAQSYCDMERAKGDTFPIYVVGVELDMPFQMPRFRSWS